ncbi:MAG: 16S rRNA (guanine(527)-N(7))-methyltransferase RsmG [Firmicutes bacterium]|nr:16S rRNA (guanine(527)-N(7))-methyltransferase RsmG [Bacillota bacterium]
MLDETCGTNVLFRKTLERAVRELGVRVDQKQLDMFCAYKQLLIEANRSVNLTSITEDSEIAVKHFADSLTCLRVVDLCGVTSIVDVGTGAGFPGLVLKIMNPAAKVLLIDSIGKKTDFVRAASVSLGLLDVESVQARAEELGGHPRYRERFDLAVARGVSGLSPLAEYCLPFVRLGGTFVAMKGPKAAQEMQSGARAVSILGGGELSTCQLELPFEAGTRVLVSATKQRSTPGRYPRRPGVPERRPLGEAGAHKKSSG